MGVPQVALMLTSFLKDNFQFSVVDANGESLSIEETTHRLRELNPQIILVSGLSVEYYEQYEGGLEVARAACPKAKVVFGGVYPTTLPEIALDNPNVDYIFIGHAEERVNHFLELLIENNTQALQSLPGIGFKLPDGRTQINPVLSYIGDVKTMIKPDYSLINLNNYLIGKQKEYQFNSEKRSTHIISSYGCIYNCLFCATRTISGRKVAMRPAQDVLEEIDFLVINYQIEEVIFVDDHFLMSNERVLEILNGLILRNYNLTFKLLSVTLWKLNRELIALLKKAGCTQLTVSVESGNPRVLKDVVHKPLKLEQVAEVIRLCREYDITIGSNFVLGFPGETWDEIRDSVRFAEECDFDITHFHLATPLPKTDLYEICKAKGYLPENFSFRNPEFFGFGKGFITTEEFTPFELEILRAFEWDRINFGTPEKVARMARLMKLSPEELNKHRQNTRRKQGIYF